VYVQVVSTASVQIPVTDVVVVGCGCV